MSHIRVAGNLTTRERLTRADFSQPGCASGRSMKSHRFRVGGNAVVIGLIASASLAIPAGSVWAQQRPQPPPAQKRQPPARRTPPKWVFEIHGGGLFGSGRPSGQSSPSYPVGAAFTTAAGTPSRAVPTWYFGDGSQLFEQVRTQFASQFNQQFGGITPLDDTLERAGTERQSAPSFGVRLTRIVSPRYSVELDVDWSGRALTLTEATSAGLEQSRATFETAFTGLVNTIPQTTTRITSSVQIPESSGGQTAVTGALVISLAKRGRLGTHVIGGGGVILNGSRAIDVQVRGTYSFSIFGTFPINETDAVTIHFADRKTSLTGLFGGGITYDFSPRRGIRADVRVLMSQSGVTTAVDASPLVQRVVPASALPSLTTPSIQFSTTTGVPTTLSGAAVTRLETFSGSGFDLRTQVTAGFFFRF